MESISSEAIFWFFFIVSNCILFAINYIFHFNESDFFPVINEFKETRKLGLTFSVNQDLFRWSAEFSLFILASRLIDLSSLSVAIVLFYILILSFNLYQYILRRIYQSEPNFYNDSKLLKNGLAIVWYESKWRLIAILIMVALFFYLLLIVSDKFLSFSYSLGPSVFYYSMASFWTILLIWSVSKMGLYVKYPNDIYLRFHFTVIEIIQNIKRSYVNYNITKKKIGQEFYKAREAIKIELIDNPPNVHIIFVESYGAYFFLEESIKKAAYQIYDSFVNALSKNDLKIISSFSESPTTGGQSWLSYSSMLYGLRIENNTYFENYLQDDDFSLSNNLLRILNKCGYTNYNVNPISPIKGINVPYDQIKMFYSIDRWILNDTLKYKGDVYGFGECAPDQYSMNFGMDLIKKENPKHYTFFYLTKNSHSPFMTPKMATDWRDLNNKSGRSHFHKGFLSNPKKEDYIEAIKYQFGNLGKFISDYANGNDIFLLIGDHQPPMLSNPKIYGSETPVHVISRNKAFLHRFQEYGFHYDLKKCESFTKHEALYSAFLRSFIKEYGGRNSIMPDYEPDGLQL